jgi:hypothetical protein
MRDAEDALKLPLDRTLGLAGPFTSFAAWASCFGRWGNRKMRGLTHYHVCQYSVWCAACAAEAGNTPRSKDADTEAPPQGINPKRNTNSSGSAEDSLKAPKA